jgi:hypothetical protein
MEGDGGRIGDCVANYAERSGLLAGPDGCEGQLMDDSLECPNGNCYGILYWSKRYKRWRCDACGWMGEVNEDEEGINADE